MSEIGKYVILFQGRAGSTLLTEHMRSHPNISAQYEAFSTLPKEWSVQLDWMTNLFYAENRGNPTQVIGFKTKLSDIADQDLFANFVQDNKIKVIHLFRKNLVKLIVSVIRADRLRKTSGDSNLYDQKNSLGKIHIDPTEFRKQKKRIRLYRELREYIDGMNVDVCRVRYEDLLYNLDRTLNRLWRYVGVKKHQTDAEVLKNTPDRLEDAVENLDELRASFPEYERFFAENDEIAAPKIV
ncbi:hypothetical protein OAF96_02285 [bacterium]|jgi:LPS sulfotransferase NodH|nr:hypothetical protein [bacterium]